MNINFVKFSPFLQPYLCLSWVLGEEVGGVRIASVFYFLMYAVMSLNFSWKSGNCLVLIFGICDIEL